MAKFTGKKTCQILLKKKLWHSCFPVNFAKFLTIPFLQNTSGRLLLKYGKHVFPKAYRWLLLYLSLTNLTAAQMCQCAMWMIRMWIKRTKKVLNFRYLICLILSKRVIPCQMLKPFARQMVSLKNENCSLKIVSTWSLRPLACKINQFNLCHYETVFTQLH